MNNLKELKLINNENIVWYIYYIIIALALITNKLEKNSIIFKDKKSKQLAEIINSIILIVAFLIYLYFYIISINNYTPTNNYKKEKIAIERIIVSILFLIAGFISIIVDYESKNINTDIGFI